VDEAVRILLEMIGNSGKENTMFLLDPSYLMYMVPAFVLMALTSWYVKASYNKWSRVSSRRLKYSQVNRESKL
jgi:hypothetical protein